MIDIELGLNKEDAKSMTKDPFKRILKHKIQQAAFIYLENIKKTHSKVSHIEYSKLELQPYLRSSQLSNKKKELLLLLRLRITKTKINYRAMYADLSCNLCYEDIPHLLDCVRIIQECEELANNTTVE